MIEFNYDTAFSRNRGFISTSEQEILKRSKVAVAGLGGTGGTQVHVMARLGIGKFTLSDPDIFELVNFNRQIGATISTVGSPKIEVAAKSILDINPTANVKIMDGINVDNIYHFLNQADVVVDSLDFGCFEERFMLYEIARDIGVWVITAPPLGFGYSLLAFDPDGMRFSEYFGINSSMKKDEQIVRFIAGLSPKSFMFSYLELKEKSLPSVCVGPFMAASAVATEVTRILTKNGSATLAAPSMYQFDAKLRKFWEGEYNHKSIIQKIRRFFISRKIKGKI